MKILSSLKRVTSQRFIPEIDGLRFVAIMPVLFMHLGTGFLDYSKDYSSKVINQENPLRRILVEGDLGVLIFFAISGFILALPFAKQHLHQGKDVQLG
ncbi:MAG: acyltransferase family protein, partial [Bacteroidota bacterium]|nr:acyltransferase family protein [Bacteroidota bacterium]